MQLKKAPSGLWNKQCCLIEQNIGQSMPKKINTIKHLTLNLIGYFVEKYSNKQGKSFDFPLVSYWGKKRLLCIGCDVVVILTTNSCDLDLCSPFHFMSIRSIMVVRKVLCFQEEYFHDCFLNRIKFTFMTMRILYMHVTMDLMHTIVYLDTLVIMDFMLVIHSSFYFLYDLQRVISRSLCIRYSIRMLCV